MHAALEIAAYVLGVTVFMGFVMLAVLVKDVFFHGRFKAPRPLARRVPTTALDETRKVIDRLQAILPKVPGEHRESVAYELRHLQLRLARLEDKAYTDQSDYYNAVRAWEKDWHEWRDLHERMGHMTRRERSRAKLRCAYLDEQYRRWKRETEEEWQRAVARDRLTLEELRAQGVLTPSTLGVLTPQTDAAKATAPRLPPKPESPATQPRGEAEGAAAGAPSASARRWKTSIPPFPLADKGVLAQADWDAPERAKRERMYVEPTFSLASQPEGKLSGADMSRSSFAEVEFTGVHRYEDCAFVVTDLRRIVLRRGEKMHQFVRCDMRGAILTQSHIANTLFRQCDLSGTHWRGARLDRVAFEQCALENVHWEGVDLSRTVMSPDILETVDFSEAASLPHNVFQDPGSPSPEASSAQPDSPGPEESPEAGEPPPEPAPTPDHAPGPDGEDAEEAGAGEDDLPPQALPPREEEGP